MTDPIKWKDMTPEQQGALLLAYHGGKSIEIYDCGNWFFTKYPAWHNVYAYRVKPEPVVEVERVTIVNADGEVIGVGTVTTYNGKPDCDSIKMERL